jgi:hypothetical protein
MRSCKRCSVRCAEVFCAKCHQHLTELAFKAFSPNRRRNADQGEEAERELATA